MTTCVVFIVILYFFLVKAGKTDFKGEITWRYNVTC